MTPLDDFAKASPAAGAKPRTIALRLAATFVLMAGSIVMWSYAFRVMSTSQILLALSIGPIGGIVFHSIRMVKFGFWEEGLLAVAVAIAFGPFMMQSWRWTPLCFVAIGLAEVGKWPMFRRWLRWRAEQEAGAGMADAEPQS